MRHATPRSALVAALVAAGAPAGAQEPPVFEADAAVVGIQVLVVDRDGVAVAGLSAEDFEVEEEGRRRPIVAFEEIDAMAPPARLEGRQSYALRSAARRQFVLLFDLSFTSPSGLVRSRDAAIEMVETGLGPADLVAVGTISVDQGVSMLVNLTSDRAQIRRAIETLGVVRPVANPDPLRLALEIGAGEMFSREQLTGQIDSQGVAADRSGMLAELIRESMIEYRRNEATQYARLVAGYLQNLAALGAAFEPIAGRKEVILLSAGFDQTPLMGVQGNEAMQNSRAITEGRLWEVDSDSHFGSAEARRDLSEALRNFAGSNAVVHTIDVTGLAAGGDASKPLGDSRPGAGRETLAQIASSGGGRFIRNTNDLGLALDELLDGSRRYYAIAFEPDASADPGEYRKLEVEVRRKGVKVSHRKGYRVPDPSRPEHPLMAQLEAAEAIAKGLSGGELEFAVAAVPYRDAAGRVAVPVTVEIDTASLFRGEEPVAELEVFGYAVAESGGIDDALSFRGSLDRSALSHGDPVQIRTAFRAQRGGSSIRFVVRNRTARRMGSRAVEVEVPEFADGATVLYPPLVMRTPEERHVVSRPSEGVGDPPQPFRVNGRDFAPALRPELASGRRSDVCVMFWTGDTYAPDAEFEIRLKLEGEGDPPALQLGLLEATHDRDGFRRYVLAVTPEGVRPGSYALRVELVDPATGGVSAAATPVTVIAP